MLNVESVSDKFNVYSDDVVRLALKETLQEMTIGYVAFMLTTLGYGEHYHSHEQACEFIVYHLTRDMMLSLLADKYRLHKLEEIKQRYERL